MVYTPITGNRETQEWVDFLTGLAETLAGRYEGFSNNIFKTDDGDIATAKDLVGNLLATITGESVEIN
jgi:hypothetical protein